MSPTTFATLQERLGNEHVVDLTLTIAFYNAVVRVLATLEIDVEPSYQRYLDEFPLPPPPDPAHGAIPERPI